MPYERIRTSEIRAVRSEGEIVEKSCEVYTRIERRRESRGREERERERGDLRRNILNRESRSAILHADFARIFTTHIYTDSVLKSVIIETRRRLHLSVSFNG